MFQVQILQYNNVKLMTKVINDDALKEEEKEKKEIIKLFYTSFIDI